MAFVILVTNVPLLQVLLKTRPLSLRQDLLVLSLGGPYGQRDCVRGELRGMRSVGAETDLPICSGFRPCQARYGNTNHG